MKTMKAIVIVALLAVVPVAVQAADWHSVSERDTVVIELENGSRIVIYTKDRTELKKLQAYDINAMVRDLNAALTDDKVEYLEIENQDGSKYLIQSPTVIVGEGESKGDTVVISEGSMDKVRIRVGGTELSVEPDKWDEDEDDGDQEIKKYTYVNEKSKATRHLFNLDVGINNWLENGKSPTNTDAPYSVKPWGSWYVGLNFLNNTRLVGPLHIEWGGGVSWYNFKLEDPSYQFVKGADQVEMVPRTDVVASKSKLSASYVNASLVPMLDFGKGVKTVTYSNGDRVKIKNEKRDGFRIGAGPYVGYRIGSRSKYVFKDQGDQDKAKESDHFYLENFRYGIRGQIGFRDFDMFVMYDLNNVFVGNKGPGGAKLNAFTIGVTL